MEIQDTRSIPTHTAAQLRTQDDSFIKNRHLVRDKCKGHNNFKTVDCVADSVKSNDTKYHQLRHPTSGIVARVLKVVRVSSLSWLCLASIGIFVGLVAAVLTIVTEYLNNIKTGYCSSHFYLNRAFCCWGEDPDTCADWVDWSQLGVVNYAVFVAMSVAFACCAGVLVKFYAPLAAGSGISEIKVLVAGFTMNGFLSWPTFFIKAFGLPLAIASGLSVGKEGPSVHYAVAAGHCVANLFRDFSSDYTHLREFLVASSAAGVAVAFGSPIGGVLFAIEEIASNFKLQTLVKAYFCSLMATSTLAVVNPFRTGQLVMFEVEYDENWRMFEMPIFVLLGVFGGVYGIVVSKYNVEVARFRKKYLQNVAIRELFVLSLFTSAICYFNEFLRLDMTESMEILFHECGIGFEHRLCNIEGKKLRIFLSLCVATLLRMFLTIISYGSKVPCGIFVPSMAAGATFGRAVGIVVENLHASHQNWAIFATCPKDKDCITPGTYAFLGAAAALSGITDLTVTVVVIMFELTGALRYILPTMITVGITKMINVKWGKGAIADQMIRVNGMPFIDAKEEHVFNLDTSHAMTTETVAVCTKTAASGLPSVSEVSDTVRTISVEDIPVVESASAPRLVGTIPRQVLLSRLASEDPEAACDFSSSHESVSTSTESFSQIVYLGSCVNTGSVVTVDPRTPLEETMEIFLKLSPRTVFVTKDNVLQGVLTKKDIIAFEQYLETLHEHDFDLAAAKMAAERASDEQPWHRRLVTVLEKFTTL